MDLILIIIISQIGEINNKKVNYFDNYNIFEGMIYNLSTWLNGIKKLY